MADCCWQGPFRCASLLQGQHRVDNLTRLSRSLCGAEAQADLHVVWTARQWLPSRAQMSASLFQSKQGSCVPRQDIKSSPQALHGNYTGGLSTAPPAGVRTVMPAVPSQNRCQPCRSCRAAPRRHHTHCPVALPCRRCHPISSKDRKAALPFTLFRLRTGVPCHWLAGNAGHHNQCWATLLSCRMAAVLAAPL